MLPFKEVFETLMQ